VVEKMCDGLALPSPMRVVAVRCENQMY
jgi:hypothetical protein